LKYLENLYSSIPADNLHEPHPTTGLPCVARFTDDGLHYRAKILSIVEDVANIFFESRPNINNKNETIFEYFPLPYLPVGYFSLFDDPSRFNLASIIISPVLHMQT
jgi:hypothetical protein